MFLYSAVPCTPVIRMIFMSEINVEISIVISNSCLKSIFLFFILPILLNFSSIVEPEVSPTRTGSVYNLNRKCLQLEPEVSTTWTGSVYNWNQKWIFGSVHVRSRILSESLVLFILWTFLRKNLSNFKLFISTNTEGNTCTVLLFILGLCTLN